MKDHENEFSYFDWMVDSGYSDEQLAIVVGLTSGMDRAALHYMKDHPVSDWSADDWQRYESSQWDEPGKLRESLVTEGFTSEEAKDISEAWEHERYTSHNLQDGYGRMHHCKFCREKLM